MCLKSKLSFNDIYCFATQIFFFFAVSSDVYKLFLPELQSVNILW